MLPRVSCFPRIESIEELIALYTRALKGNGRIRKGGLREKVHTPMTPAELPIKVPLRVTELRMLLIRNLEFETASGRRAPSRSPHTAPEARPA